MFKRIITAVIAIPLIILLVKTSSDFIFFAAILVVIVLALKELFEIMLAGEPAFEKWIAIMAGCLVPAFVFFGIKASPESSLCLSSAPYAVLVFCLIAFFIYYIVLPGKEDNTFSVISAKFFGIFYVAVLLSYLLPINAHPQGANLLLFLLFVTWAGDSGAYFIGSSIGKRPLAPSISPKKTVEGAVGSVVSSVLAALLCQTLLLNTFDITSCAVMGLGINIFNQFGDLAESMIKRAYKVKDSGNIIPGHGGVLDRIDSLLFAVPFLYYYLKVFNTSI
jgi:phosphatidate cytidylyltransferase